MNWEIHEKSLVIPFRLGRGERRVGRDGAEGREHAVQSGFKNHEIVTGDTDVVVILISSFDLLQNSSEGISLNVAFGFGENYKFFSINAVCNTLREDVSRSLIVFHAFTGADTTSCFRGKGKATCWSVWKAYEEATEAFLFIADNEHCFPNNRAVYCQDLWQK